MYPLSHARRTAKSPAPSPRSPLGTPRARSRGHSPSKQALQRPSCQPTSEDKRQISAAKRCRCRKGVTITKTHAHGKWWPKCHWLKIPHGYTDSNPDKMSQQSIILSRMYVVTGESKQNVIYSSLTHKCQTECVLNGQIQTRQIATTNEHQMQTISSA